MLCEISVFSRYGMQLKVTRTEKMGQEAVVKIYSVTRPPLKHNEIK